MVSWPVRPSRTALRRVMALPSGVRGPVDFCELRRLAASCFSETMKFPSCGTAFSDPTGQKLPRGRMGNGENETEMIENRETIAESGSVIARLAGKGEDGPLPALGRTYVGVARREFAAEDVEGQVDFLKCEITFVQVVKNGSQ